MLTVRRRLGRDDAGVTLTELVVAMVIGMLVLTLATTFFVRAYHNGYQTVSTNQASGDARSALQSWTDLIRFAGWLDPAATARTDRFEEVTPTKIVFYANLGNAPTSCPTAPVQCSTLSAPTKIVLMLQPVTGSAWGRLVEIRLNPADNTTVQTERTVALGAKQTGSQPIFQPFSTSDTQVPISSTNGCYDTTLRVAVPGYCLQTPPSTAGLLDPTLPTNSSTPVSGPLRGTSAVNGDAVLQDIAGVTISFSVIGGSGTTSSDFTGSASVNSVFKS